MKFILVLLPLLAVGCGKGELGDNARIATAKGLGDGFNTVGKAIKDTFAEADRSADSVITKANDAKNTVLANTGNFTEGIGKGAEGLVQAPKNIVNGILGNDENSEKKDREIETDIENTNEDLEELEALVNEIYLELLQELADVNGELGELKGEISRVEGESQARDNEQEQALENQRQELRGLISAIHTEILDEINSLKRKDRKALKKIRRVKNKLRNLRQLIREVRRDVRNLEASCYTYRTYGYYYHFERFRTYCEIYTEDEYENEYECDEDDDDDDCDD